MWDLVDFNSIKRWHALHLLLCVTFFLSSLFINGIQCLLFILLRPCNKAIYRKINYYLMYTIMSQILFLAEWWSGSDVRVYTSADSLAKWGKEHALIVMNHTYEIDWLMGWIVADRSRILGASKVFVKRMIKFVPTIGWAWCFSDVIFLRRNWKADKSIIQNQISEFFDYPYPVWMLLFAEGTRFTAAKHKASVEFAKERGLPVLKNLLIPRKRGFIQSLKGNFSAVYDVTVTFNTQEGAEPTFLNVLQGRKVLGELYVQRIPLEQIPEDDEASSNYLMQLYETKDKLVESYKNTGSFSKESKLPDYPVHYMPRRYWSLVNVIFWTLLILTLIVQFYYSLLTTGSAAANIASFAVIVLAYIALVKMVGLTRIDKGSQYGDKRDSKTK